jgi:hypothetical protein
MCRAGGCKGSRKVSVTCSEKGHQILKHEEARYVGKRPDCQKAKRQPDPKRSGLASWHRDFLSAASSGCEELPSARPVGVECVSQEYANAQ